VCRSACRSLRKLNKHEIAGDGVLQKQGTTVIWFGWQGDVLPGDNRMLTQLPKAKNKDGSPVTGVVRSELTTLSPTTSLNLSSGWFTGMTHASYSTVETDNTKELSGGFRPTLTIRAREDAPREVIPASAWHYHPLRIARGERDVLNDGVGRGRRI
jgi:hypothetical protein